MDKGIMFGLGVIIVGIIIYLLGKKKNTVNNLYHKKSNLVNEMFYEQHKLLFELRSLLVDKKKTEEIIFFEKRKFLSHHVNDENLDKFLINGQKEVDFLLSLRK